MKRILLLAVILLLLAMLAAVGWRLADLPPVGFVLRYGLTPSCEPTGQVKKIEGIEFVEIGPGCFRMGSTHLAEGGDFLGKLCADLGLPWGDQPKPSDEMPVHWVEFEDGFWIARTEVTNTQYERFRSEHARGEYSAGDRHPVVNVSWKDAKAYCRWLSKGSGHPIRLPTEAEWEAACRAGIEAEFCGGDLKECLSDYAWYVANSRGGAREVGTRRANDWGLFDFHGNVWEWCEDGYHAGYEGAPEDGSAWMRGGEVFAGTAPAMNRICRGGCWAWPAQHSRSGSRNRVHEGARDEKYGFRVGFSRPGS